MRKICLWLAVLAAVGGSGGCCRWCDRWCGNHHAGGYSPAAACVPCQPVQCCPTPAAAPVCCPTPAGSSPAAGWARQPACP